MLTFNNFEEFLEAFMVGNAPGVLWISEGEYTWTGAVTNFKDTTDTLWLDTPKDCGLTLTEAQLQNKISAMNDAGQIPAFIAQVRGL
jgi:hypothetical protein